MNTIQINVHQINLARICEALSKCGANDIIVTPSVTMKDFFIIQWSNSTSKLMEELAKKSTQDIMDLVKTNQIKDYLDKSKVDMSWSDQNAMSVGDINGSVSFFDSLRGSKNERGRQCKY